METIIATAISNITPAAALIGHSDVVVGMADAVGKPPAAAKERLRQASEAQRRGIEARIPRVQGRPTRPYACNSLQ